MKQTRRSFLKKLPLAMSVPFTIAGIPIRVMGDNQLSRLAKASAAGDRVLVILQLHGGNDGLNTLVPVDKYDSYYSKRPNIAIPKSGIRKYIPLDSTLPAEMQVGLHPDMQAMKEMYDTGKVTFVQGVSYKNNNGSHFRGRDIWFMGGSSEDYYSSGWIGRYLQQEIAPKTYPEDFPEEGDGGMKDPLAIEMGSDVSLIFHQEGNIPMSISVEDPEYFAKLVGELEGFIDEGIDPRGLPPGFLSDSNYFNELNWILSLEDKSKSYAERLFQVWKDGGESSIAYPEKYPLNAPKASAQNLLAPQLKLIARMLAGNCKTKVFLVKAGGFDTHAGQVESYDTTMGTHAALLYHVSSAMKAFQQDLKARGLEDCVLTVTTSEFGRRVKSNGSYGTDHGSGGPMMIFGKGADPGIIGSVPDLEERNVELQYDYREIYANIMKKWMGVSDDRLNEIFPGIMTVEGTSDGVKYKDIAVAQSTITGSEGFVSSRFTLEECYPNPAKEKTTIHFRVNAAYHVKIDLVDLNGKTVRVIVNETLPPGEYKREVNLSAVKPGSFICKMVSGTFHQSRKLIIVE
jgi:uncharacterized protein (DUF1501 family)